MDKGLLDVAVIALRKALFGKSSGGSGGRGSGGDGRRAACAGLCQVLRAVSAGGCCGADDGAAGSLSQSLSQSRFGTGGVEAAERGVLLHEVFGLLRRGLGQQGGVRAQVYASLADAVAAAPGLAPQAAALLYQHLCAFCPHLDDDYDDDGDGDDAWPVSVEGVGWEGCGAEPVPLLVAALGRVAKHLGAGAAGMPGRGSGGDDELGAEERAGRAVRAAVGRLAERVAAFDPVCAAGFVDGDAEWKRGVCRLYRGVCGALVECLLCTCNGGDGEVSPGAGVVQAIAGLDRRAAALGDYVSAMDASAGGAKKKKAKKKGRRASKRGGDDEDNNDEDGEEDDGSDEGSDGEDAEPPKKVARRGRGPAKSSSSSSSPSCSGDEAAWQWAGEELLSLESVRVLAAGMEGCVWDEGVRRLVVGSALGHLRRIAGAEGGGACDSGRAAAAASEFCLYVGSRLFGRYLAPLLDNNDNNDNKDSCSEEEAAEGCDAVRLCVVYFARHGTSAELREFLRECIGDADTDPDLNAGDRGEDEGDYGDRDERRAGAERSEAAGRAMDFYARSFEVRENAHT